MEQRLRLPSALALLVALGGAAGLGLSASSARAEDPKPVWTQVPTRIDRDKDTRERLEPLTRPDDRLFIVADKPIVLGPDGSFRSQGRQVRLFGIQLPPWSQLCETPSGARWACGMRANTYFRYLLTGKVLACRPRSNPGATVLLVDCTSTGRDIGRQLLAEGWASTDAIADDDQKAAEADARTAHRGLWLDRLPDF